MEDPGDDVVVGFEIEEFGVFVQVLPEVGPEWGWCKGHGVEPLQGCGPGCAARLAVSGENPS